MKLAIAVLLAACSHGPQASWPTARHPATSLVQPLPVGPATAVVTLETDVPSAVLRGPFLVTTINPAGGLDLAIAATACDEPGVIWFEYSGGGVAVGTGQILCARSYRSGARVQGFSGRNEAAPAVGATGGSR